MKVNALTEEQKKILADFSETVSEGNYPLGREIQKRGQPLDLRRRHKRIAETDVDL